MGEVNKATYRYSREQSYADGINVPPRIYRIKTEVTEGGGLISEGDKVTEVTKKTGKTKAKVQTMSSVYTSTELDRSVVNPTQIEKVITEFRDVVFERLFPNRIPENGVPDYRYIPKTLFFAKNRQHALNIIETIERVFAEKFPESHVPEGFVQEITCSVEKPNDRIRAFNNDKNFRIAVTVTLVSTGTDVKPLEVVAFMRDVHSDVLYTQMKGRGCRSVSDDLLRTVTPNADTKANFVLLDAVGVALSEKRMPKACEDSSDKKPLKLSDLLERISHGEVSDANLELLAEKCSTIYNRTNDEHNAEFRAIAGFTLRDFSLTIFEAFEKNLLPEYTNINEPNLERRKLVSPLINNNNARVKLSELHAGYLSILNPGEDRVIYSEFLEEDALKHTFVESKMFRVPLLWDYYRASASENHKMVIPLKGKNEIESITNLIQLVRYALGRTETLQSIQGIAAKRFGLYVGQQMGDTPRNFTPAQVEVLRKVAQYVAQNGCTSRKDLFEFDQTLAVQTINIYSPAKADKELDYLSKFLLQIKAA